MNVTQALISVSDKRGVLDFARKLSPHFAEPSGARIGFEHFQP